ncbi:hypothetical protein DRN74_04325 [Candidatus Micrarchaeota archaeon]|nr:MAG: hypothetical protein DRN74_04325 [Candidatus Micrarchaeota archaeon]
MGEMTGEDRIFKFCMAVFVLLLSYYAIYGVTNLFKLLIFLVALTAVILMLKGVVEIILYGEHQSFSSGGAIAVLLVLLFQGMPVLINAFLFIASIPLTLLSMLKGF